MTDKEVSRFGIRKITDEKANQSKLKFDKVTFSLTNPIQIKYVLEVLKSEFCDVSQKTKYLYICHNCDTSDTEPVSVHYHFLVWGNPRRFKDWANAFSIPNDSENAIPPHMFCKVMNVRGLARYLIHKDSPDKYQYSSECVKGSPNGLAFFEQCLIDRESLSFDDEVKDFYALRQGIMSPQEFLKKYSYYYARESFGSRMRIYASVFEHANRQRSVYNGEDS